MSTLTRLTGTGTAKTGKGSLKSVALQGGSANSTVIVYDNTEATGTVLISLAAIIGTSAVWTSGVPDGAYVAKGLHAVLAGTGAIVTLEYE